MRGRGGVGGRAGRSTSADEVSNVNAGNTVLPMIEEDRKCRSVFHDPFVRPSCFLPGLPFFSHESNAYSLWPTVVVVGERTVVVDVVFAVVFGVVIFVTVLCLPHDFFLEVSGRRMCDKAIPMKATAINRHCFLTETTTTTTIDIFVASAVAVTHAVAIPLAVAVFAVAVAVVAVAVAAATGAVVQFFAGGGGKTKKESRFYIFINHQRRRW